MGVFALKPAHQDCHNLTPTSNPNHQPQTVQACAKVFTKTTRVDAHGERPYFLNPLIAATQLFNVSLPGQEPGLWDATEDCRWVVYSLVG